MRPANLFQLFSPINKLPSVGQRIAKLIEKITGPNIIDLLWHLPREIIDRRYYQSIEDAENNRIATFRIQIKEHMRSSRKGQPYRVRCSDGSGTLLLVFFHAREDYLTKLLPIGAKRIVS